MYFRFPLILLFVFLGIFALLFVQGKVGQDVTVAQSEPLQGVFEENTDKLFDETAARMTIRANDLRAHVDFLADDLLEGRDTGSRGARIASMYIAAQFERLGLQSVGDDNSYFQSVPLSEKKTLSTSKMKIEIDGEMVPLQYKKDFLVISSPALSGSTIAGEMVFTGFGITAAEYDYDDYKNLDVNEKISVYVSGEPSSDDEQFFEGDKATRYSGGPAKRGTAQNAGATASIGIVREEQLAGFGWDGLVNFLTSSRIALNNEDDSDVPAFPAILLHPDAAELLFAGTTMTYDKIDEQASQGSVTPFALQKKVEIKFEFEENEIIDRNVVGFLEGSDPELKSEVIVFTAHYDHVGIGIAAKGDSIYNGAADNASGTSGLLELAEAFSALPVPPKRSLLFLAVTAEEKGLLGSQYYAENPIFPIEKTIANFNLDMIGIGDTTAIILYGEERSTLGETVRKASEQVGLQVWQDSMPEQRVFYRSDHYNFAKVGVPAIMPSFAMKREQFPEFSTFYHKPADDINLAWLNFNTMQKHVQAVFLAGLWTANAEDAPQWSAGDEFGEIRKNNLK